PFSTLPANGAGSEYVLRQIVADVQRLRDGPRFDEADLRYYRYVSFNHLLAAGITKEELDEHVRALTLAINHASSQPYFEKPSPFYGSGDQPATVSRINIQSLGWPRPAFATAPEGARRRLTLWDLVTLECPFAMMPAGSQSYARAVRGYLAS